MRPQSASCSSVPITPARFKGAAVAFLALAVLLLGVGATMVVPGLARVQVDAFIQDWRRRGAEPDVVALLAAKSAAERTVTWVPVAMGDYQDRLGKVYSWQFFLQPFAEPKATASRAAALQAYRASVAARPAEPDTHARLLYTNLYLQQFDAGFDRALTQAAILGDWRISLNRELAEVGPRSWSMLTPSQRSLTLQQALRTVAYSRTESRRTLTLAENSGLHEVLCSEVAAAQKARHGICLQAQGSGLKMDTTTRIRERSR